MTMLVSIVVPTYNRAHMIETTVKSILNQTYKDIEIIIVDDGSTDDTEDVVRKIAHGSAMPIRYFSKPNGGCSSARNMGVRMAEGECIAFLDSDDQFTPNAIESLVAVMEKSGADFVYSPSIEVNERGVEMFALPAAPGQPELFAREHFMTALARSCCILYCRKIFDSLTFLETERYNEDTDFLQKVAITYTAAYSDIPTAKVFQHGANKSSNRIAIGRALLKSYVGILEQYPVFAQSLGELADRRLDEVRDELAEALVAGRDFPEAGKVLEVMGEKPPELVLSVMLRSALPLVLCKQYRNLKRIARKGFRKVLGMKTH